MCFLFFIIFLQFIFSLKYFSEIIINQVLQFKDFTVKYRHTDCDNHLGIHKLVKCAKIPAKFWFTSRRATRHLLYLIVLIVLWVFLTIIRLFGLIYIFVFGKNCLLEHIVWYYRILLGVCAAFCGYLVDIDEYKSTLHSIPFSIQIAKVYF